MPVKAEMTAVDAELTAEAETYRGYSAYELAVQHGFQGSEADWLASLHASAGTVNGQGPDENGDIKLDAAAIPVSGEENAGTVAQRLQSLADGLATKIGAQAALEAISQKASTASYTAALSSAGWSAAAPYSQTVNVAGLLATDDPLVDVSLNGADTAQAGKARTDAWTFVGRVETGNGTLTAYCYEEKPEVDLPVIIKVVR